MEACHQLSLGGGVRSQRGGCPLHLVTERVRGKTRSPSSRRKRRLSAIARTAGTILW
jgi:hypothetical protein